MKKLLLGSTALVVGGVMAAPAMAADPIKMGIGGYYTFYALAGNIDSSYAFDGSFTTYKGLAFTQEGEIHFIGQTKLDNGTSVGLTVELEAWNPGIGVVGGGTAGSNIHDRRSLHLRLRRLGPRRAGLARRRDVPYVLRHAVGADRLGCHPAQPQLGQRLGHLPTTRPTAATMATTITPTWQDVNRINYFTPRFAGPADRCRLRAQDHRLLPPAARPSAGPLNVAGSCGFAGATNINNCPSADYAWQDAFDVGANYLNKFGDFTVALYGAFAYATFVPGLLSRWPAAANMATGANLTTWKQWVLGAQFGFAGFTVGGAIGWDNNGVGANYFTGVDNDTRFYTAGIMYETGPWQMSFMWAGFYNTNGNGNSNTQSIAPGTNLATQHRLRRRAGRQQHLLQWQSGDRAVLR